MLKTLSRSLLISADTPRSLSNRKPAKSKPSTLKSTKNTKHLELALKKKLSAAPTLTLDVGQDYTSQRYTRFPSARVTSTNRSLHHDLRDSSSSEPTHQRLVISASGHNNHSSHQRLTIQRTMPKSKSSAPRASETVPTVPRARSGSSDLDRSGSFMNKPVRGWLHPDRQISDTGISYGVRVCFPFFLCVFLSFLVLCRARFAVVSEVLEIP